MKNRHIYLSARITKDIQALGDCLNKLEGLLGKSAQSVRQYDQITYIHAFKASIAEELRHGESSEIYANSGFSKARLITGTAGLFLSGLIGAARKNKNPLLLGAYLMSESLNRKEPFGTLTISLKEGSGFEEVKVISISQLARDNSTTESDICSSLRSQGILLIPKDQFWEAISELELSIQKGQLETMLQVEEEFIKLMKRLSQIRKL
jgi:hypothetical protein